MKTYVKDKKGGISLAVYNNGNYERHIYFESFAQRTKFIKSIELARIQHKIK